MLHQQGAGIKQTAVCLPTQLDYPTVASAAGGGLSELAGKASKSRVNSVQLRVNCVSFHVVEIFQRFWTSLHKTH